MKSEIAVLGRDERTRAAWAWLAAQGWPVAGPEGAGRAPALLLPMPLAGREEELAGMLEGARPGALALGGRVSGKAAELAAAKGVELVDYYDREELALLNSALTAEGCIWLLLDRRQKAILGSRVLVTGCGRVGLALLARLRALGAQVLGADRSPARRASALALGCEACSLEEAPKAAAGFEVVVNTIPARVLGRQLWQALAPGSLAVELAGEPGGMEEAQVLAAGHTLVRGPALPARVCPVSAGQAVGRATAQILRERGIL